MTKAAPVGYRAPASSDVVWTSLSASVLGRGERRLEGETYLAGGYGIRQRIEASGATVKRLGELAMVWQPARLKGVNVGPEHGVPFLTATQVFDIRPTPRKWLAPARTDDFERRFLQPGWILVTCSGNVGDSTISYEPHLGALVSHDLLRVQVTDDGWRGYVYCFLRTNMGRAILRSSQYGSIIKHLEPEHVQPIPVPLAPASVVQQAGHRIAEAFRLRAEAHALLLEAERLYASCVGLPTEPDGPQSTFSSTASAMSTGGRRLDAYHYNPRAQRVLATLRASGHELEPLGRLVHRVFLPNRFRRVFAEAGVSYLDSEDIFKLNPELTKRLGEVATDAAKYRVRKGWLLLARSGQLYGLNGSVMLADTWHQGKVVSEHIIRIVPGARTPRSGYLQVALGHPSLGRPLVLRLAFGTEVPEIAPQDVGDLPIPRLGQDDEDAIADRAEQASALRMKANDIEDGTVHLVEGEIERHLAAGRAASSVSGAQNVAEPKEPYN